MFRAYRRINLLQTKTQVQRLKLQTGLNYKSKSDYWINELKKNTYDIKNKYS